jgi:hypothetical protein
VLQAHWSLIAFWLTEPRQVAGTTEEDLPGVSSATLTLGSFQAIVREEFQRLSVANFAEAHFALPIGSHNRRVQRKEVWRSCAVQLERADWEVEPTHVQAKDAPSTLLFIDESNK